MGAYAFPVFALVNTGQPVLIVAAFAISIGVIWAAFAGIQGSWFSELFSITAARPGASIGYQFAASISGFAPFIGALLASRYGWHGPAAFIVPAGHFRVPTNPTHTKSSPYLPLELLATRAFHPRTVANNLHPHRSEGDHEMSPQPLTDNAKKMLSKPNPSVISTLRRDGQPVSAATWYLLRDDHILVNMDNGRVRLQHMRNDPRVSLTVIDEADWYTHVTIIGRVTKIYDDDNFSDIDALSRHYTGKPYPRRDRPRVNALIEIDRVHGWGAQKNNDQPDGRGSNT